MIDADDFPRLIAEIAKLDDEKLRDRSSITQLTVASKPISCCCPNCIEAAQTMLDADILIAAIKALVTRHPDIDIRATIAERLATMGIRETDCPHPREGKVTLQ